MPRVVAVWGIACAAFVMGLSLLHGAAVFNTCSSIASAGLCIDYALPIGFRLFLARNNFEPGPFTLGRYAVKQVLLPMQPVKCKLL